MFHHLLRKLREEKGLTQREVADRCGYTLGQISHLETGRRQVTLNSMPKLAKALGVPVWRLLPEDWLPKQGPSDGQEWWDQA